MKIELDVVIDPLEQSKESDTPWILLFNEFHDESTYIVSLPIRENGCVSASGADFHPCGPFEHNRLLWWSKEAEAFARSLGFKSVQKLVEFYIDQARRWGKHGVLHGDPSCSRFPFFFYWIDIIFKR